MVAREQEFVGRREVEGERVEKSLVRPADVMRAIDVTSLVEDGLSSCRGAVDRPILFVLGRAREAGVS
jgi:hypothetical protein